MQSTAALGEERRDGRVGRGRLDELDALAPRMAHQHVDLLVRDVLDVAIALEAEPLDVGAPRLRQARHHDRDVVQAAHERAERGIHRAHRPSGAR